MDQPLSEIPARALGIDLGEARIGLALSDMLGMMAHPCETLNAREGDPIKRILEVIKKEKVSVIVLGLPRNMDGTDGPAAAKSRAFAEKLRARAKGCEVRLLDERLTTVAAQKALHASGRNVKNSRSIIDQVAAQMLLQTYLDGEAMRKERMKNEE
jgi:putative Holliday junction resolvase